MHYILQSTFNEQTLKSICKSVEDIMKVLEALSNEVNKLNEFARDLFYLDMMEMAKIESNCPMLEKFNKQRTPRIEEECQYGFTGTCVYCFGLFRWGRIYVFLLLALPSALQFNMMTPQFIPSDNTRQKCILFLMVSLQQGWAYLQIANDLHYFVSVVYRAIKHYRESGQYERRHGQGRKRKTTGNQDRLLLLFALHRRTSTACDLQNNFKLDESRLSLTSCDGRLRVWRRRGECLDEPNIVEIDTFGGGSIMVWASISLETKTALTVVSGLLSAIGFVENILQQHVLSVMEHMGAEFVLMHDNMRAHFVAVSMNFLNEHEIPVMDWPAISRPTDLNSQ
ncbi:hypothetical protein ANN_09515 [Periplaneta americana]|uniref:Uncharacterized protein n=1 Tax=Periplaneta americana TaxID=6978 RepID=A0ABQ8TLJ0_PERAM|nr:hypothetical protein ANN_09515 [Periplaneta americana]